MIRKSPPPKPQSHYQQSGVIPYRISNGQLEVLLITTRKQKRWSIPKGFIEAELSPQESAAKEAWEEAGIQGTVVDEPVGQYQFSKNGNTCNVLVYLLHVDKIFDDWPEANFRKRKWVSLDEAEKRIKSRQLRSLFELGSAQLEALEIRP